MTEPAMNAMLQVFDENAARLEPAEDKVDALLAERDAHRTALEMIADRAEMADEYPDPEAAFRRAGELARAALSAGEAM